MRGCGRSDCRNRPIRHGQSTSLRSALPTTMSRPDCPRAELRPASVSIARARSGAARCQHCESSGENTGPRAARQYGKRLHRGLGPAVAAPLRDSGKRQAERIKHPLARGCGFGVTAPRRWMLSALAEPSGRKHPGRSAIDRSPAFRGRSNSPGGSARDQNALVSPGMAQGYRPSGPGCTGASAFQA
jgi:hypothetical protein